MDSLLFGALHRCSARVPWELLASGAQMVASKLRSIADRQAAWHLKRFPLSEAEQRAVMDLYLRGESLCCGKGMANLRHVLRDPIWVSFINERAYETLGCSEKYRPGGEYFEEGKEELRNILHHGQSGG